MRSRNPRREALKVFGLTVATGAIGFATLQLAPAQAYPTGLGLPDENFATLLNQVRGQAENPAPIPLPARAITPKSSSDDIRSLQEHLKWAGLSNEEPSGTWTEQTSAGVKQLHWKTNTEQTNRADTASVVALSKLATTDKLDKNCTKKGTVLCVDKTQKVVRYVTNGKVLRTVHINIGPEKGDKNYRKYSATREGQFTIGEKKKDSVSTLYGYPMPYWMQFDKGIGFHYSKYFNAAGYQDSSMGCVTIANKADAEWLFNNTDMASAKVVVYSS